MNGFQSRQRSSSEERSDKLSLVVGDVNNCDGSVIRFSSCVFAYIYMLVTSMITCVPKTKKKKTQLNLDLKSSRFVKEYVSVVLYGLCSLDR